jgi:hypothetical protein
MKQNLSGLRKIIRQEIRLIKEQPKESEVEQTVERIKEIMDRVDLTGEGGLLRLIDNKDEFEDLVRHIFDETGFPNEKLGIIALKIAQDFMKEPDAAAKMSKFNV